MGHLNSKQVVTEKFIEKSYLRPMETVSVPEIATLLGAIVTTSLALSLIKPGMLIDWLADKVVGLNERALLSCLISEAIAELKATDWTLAAELSAKIPELTAAFSDEVCALNADKTDASSAELEETMADACELRKDTSPDRLGIRKRSETSWLCCSL